MTKSKVLVSLLYIGICIQIVAPVLPYCVSRFLVLRLPKSTFYNDWAQLLAAGFGRYKVIDYVQHCTSPKSRFLVFRQNDFACYSNRTFVRHLDPKLIPIYRLKNKKRAFSELVKMGVDYIFLPSYMTPTFTDTCIHKIVADPLLCHLVVEAGGSKLYELRNGISHEMTNIADYRLIFDGTENKWTVYWSSRDYETVDLSGRKPTRIIPHRRITYVFNGVSDLWSYPVNDKNELSLKSGTYKIEAEVTGEGWVNVFLLGHGDTNKRKLIKLWESSLYGKKRHIANQFLVRDGFSKARLVFEIRSVKPFTISRVKIWSASSELESSAPTISSLLPWNTLSSSIRAIRLDGETVSFKGTMKQKQFIYSGDGNWVLPGSFYSRGYLPTRLSPFQRAYEVSFNVQGNGTVTLYCIVYGKSLPKQMFIDKISLNANKRKTVKYILILPQKCSDFRLAMELARLPLLKRVYFYLIEWLGGYRSIGSIEIKEAFWNIILGPVKVKQIPNWRTHPYILKCVEKYVNYRDKWCHKWYDDVVVCRPNHSADNP